MARKPAAAPAPTEITLPKFDLRVVHIKLIGDSPLICHAWSAKAKKQMLDKQMKKAKPGREAKDPEADYKESLYHLPGGKHGFPAIAFKAAAVGACRFVEGVKMTEARGAFHIDQEMIQIDGKPSPREDMVRIGLGTADIRYRGEFKEWSAILPVKFNAGSISAEQIVNLFNVAGFGVGVGEWRPERDGQFGRFHVATSADKR